MDKIFLEKNGTKLGTMEFKGGLYSVAAGESTYYLYEGNVYRSDVHFNTLEYTGKNDTYIIGTYEDVVAAAKANLSMLRPEYQDDTFLQILNNK